MLVLCASPPAFGRLKSLKNNDGPHLSTTKADEVAFNSMWGERGEKDWAIDFCP